MQMHPRAWSPEGLLEEDMGPPRPTEPHLPRNTAAITRPLPALSPFLATAWPLPQRPLRPQLQVLMAGTAVTPMEEDTPMGPIPRLLPNTAAVAETLGPTLAATAAAMAVAVATAVEDSEEELVGDMADTTPSTAVAAGVGGTVEEEEEDMEEGLEELVGTCLETGWEGWARV